ncbi:MAG TPA: hypothetical protein VM571_08075 [Noviherbaspirillum sp.]|nr:hypothetical protein [Noviherbaspirillum sp.]
MARHLRNKALPLLGFWRGFRGDELTRLRIEHVDVVPGEGMTCYFPQTNGDRQNQGTTFKAPALSRLCPIEAYATWIAVAQLTDQSSNVYILNEFMLQVQSHHQKIRLRRSKRKKHMAFLLIDSTTGLQFS